MTSGVTICGRRVRLRPTNQDDLALLVNWLGLPEVYRWWGGSPVPEAVVREKYLGLRGPRVASYVIEFQGVPVGYAQSHRESPAGGGMDLFIAPAGRKQGLGLDAARALAGHLVNVLEWTSVSVDPSVDNTVAVQFWTRAGFQPSGGASSGESRAMVYRGS